MTTKQRREHKIGNQLRKTILIRLAKEGNPTQRNYFAQAKVGQDGKYTLQARVRIANNFVPTNAK